ncbi:MAG: sulfatase [bacterium]|nr:sulfatase [bacterium]
MPKLALPWFLLLSLPVIAACRPAAEPGSEVPLLDGRHAPDVLTESLRLELPPVAGGNRFVQGWHLWRRPDGLRMIPRPEGSRLEIVQLEPRARRLILRTSITGAAVDAAVQVRVGDREVGRFPLAGPSEIPLPADLPLGRVPIDLRFPEGTDVVLEGAGMGEALSPGVVELADEEIVQSGWSLVDFVRPVPGGSVLLGRFVPPENARPQQHFTLRIEREDGRSTAVLQWRADFTGRLLGTRRIAAPLGPETGLVRIRLLASGEGPAARWQGLRLRLPGPQPADTPSEPPPPPRVVVLYVLDALRADHLSHSQGASPTLDRLAAEGVLFTRHLSLAPNTLPSTKSLFTGQAFLTKGGWKLPAEGPETLAEIFARAGYRTGVFSGNDYVSAAYGTARGFDHQATGIGFQKDSEHGPSNDNAERVHRAALGWLEELPPEERVFLYLHTVHPHNPYAPPEPFRSRFTAGIESRIDGRTRTLLEIERGRRPVSSADQQRIRGLYAGGLAYNDARIATFLEEIRRRYPPGEVLLIVTSDHGEELFDHGGLLHGYTLLEEMLHIPLVFWWPPRLAAGRVDAATDTLDVHETLRSLLRAPPSARGEGRPLWDHLLGTGSGSSGKEVRFAAAASVKGGIFMARSERYKLILAPRSGRRWGMGAGWGRTRDPEYFFDLVSDPAETENRAGESSLAAAWLRSRLLAWIERGKALETGVEVTELDEPTRERLQALGYLE